MNSKDSFFDNLKQYRESQNIEISEICEFTKINPRYIQAIEEGNFQVLPNVYIRLFLRAYAEYIGADSEKSLLDFTLYTTGKLSSETELELKPKTAAPTSSLTGGQMKQDLSQITPKQIASGAGVIMGILLILFWAGKITEEQKQEIESLPIEVSKAPADLGDEIISPDSEKTAQPAEESLEKKKP